MLNRKRNPTPQNTPSPKKNNTKVTSSSKKCAKNLNDTSEIQISNVFVSAFKNDQKSACSLKTNSDTPYQKHTECEASTIKVKEFELTSETKKQDFLQQKRQNETDLVSHAARNTNISKRSKVLIVDEDDEVEKKPVEQIKIKEEPIVIEKTVTNIPVVEPKKEPKLVSIDPKNFFAMLSKPKEDFQKEFNDKFAFEQKLKKEKEIAIEYKKKKDEEERAENARLQSMIEDSKKYNIVNDTSKKETFTVDAKGYMCVSRMNVQVEVTNENSDMLTIKHNPVNLDEIVGNRTKINELIRFLENWSSSDKSGSKKAALISGPAGIGKTSTIRLIAKLKGYSLFEMNASDQRNKAVIDVIF